MKRCKTCDWWIEFGGEQVCDNRTKLGEFGAVDECNATLVYAYREGGYFTPGPEFGCVHHEEKEGKRSIRTEEGELRCREASEFCDGPAGIAPEPDCEKAIYLLRELVAYIERE